MKGKYIKLSNLKVGDIFAYEGTMYEIIRKDKWSCLCKCINDTKNLSYVYTPEYLYCSFSNYVKVEI